jgi:hypothetical protein
MGRRLAEATKAWRTRRTRGETVLRRFAVFALAAALFVPMVFVPVEATGLRPGVLAAAVLEVLDFGVGFGAVVAGSAEGLD